jgi:hypothetical protein
VCDSLGLISCSPLFLFLSYFLFSGESVFDDSISVELTRSDWRPPLFDNECPVSYNNTQLFIPLLFCVYSTFTPPAPFFLLARVPFDCHGSISNLLHNNNNNFCLIYEGSVMRVRVSEATHIWAAYGIAKVIFTLGLLRRLHTRENSLKWLGLGAGYGTADLLGPHSIGTEFAKPPPVYHYRAIRSHVDQRHIHITMDCALDGL